MYSVNSQIRPNKMCDIYTGINCARRVYSLESFIRNSNIKRNHPNVYIFAHFFFYCQHVVFEFINSFPPKLLLVVRFAISLELFWKKRPEEYRSCRIAYVDGPWEQSQKDLWPFVRFMYSCDKKIEKKMVCRKKKHDRLLFSDTKENRNSAQKKNVKLIAVNRTYHCVCDACSTSGIEYSCFYTFIVLIKRGKR